MTVPLWIKSSYSVENGSCVEVAPRWTKSSYSAENGACVEVAATPTITGVRDSKNPDGPVLTFAGTGWATFLERLQNRG